MLTAIISDVHGNLPALQKALDDCKYVDAIINLGDVVNYGPWGNECVDLLKNIHIPLVNLKGRNFFILRPNTPLEPVIAHVII